MKYRAILGCLGLSLLWSGCSREKPSLTVTTGPGQVEVKATSLQVQVSGTPTLAPLVSPSQVVPSPGQSAQPDQLKVDTPTAQVEIEPGQMKVNAGDTQVDLESGHLGVEAGGVKVDMQGGGVKVDLPGLGVSVDQQGVGLNGVELEGYLKGFQRLELPEIQVPGVTVRQGEGRTVYAVPGDVLFDFDKAEIRPDAAQALIEVAHSLEQRYPGAAVRIEGHSDSKGSDSYNLKLSERRAGAVQKWLARQGLLKGCALEVVGRGESRPVAPNQVDGQDNPEGRQQNRRVELSVEGQ